LVVYLSTEEGPGTVPFSGRDEEFECLDRWLGDNQAPRELSIPPLLVNKSAFLIH
jgi:hypothetical protein